MHVFQPFGARLLAAACLSALCAAAQNAPAEAPKEQRGQWQSMFDGKTLTGWKETEFTGRGKSGVSDGSMVLGAGYITGVNWTSAFPKTNYEFRLEAARMDGSDFFAGITFPVGDAFCTWINGGWGGTVVGLSSLEDASAAENETTSNIEFKNGRWYALRLRVTDQAVSAWIDDAQVIQVERAGREFGLRFGEIELSKPFGIAAYETKAALRKLEYRLLAPEQEKK
jgi:hypothetical protein